MMRPNRPVGSYERLPPRVMNELLAERRQLVLLFVIED
jgi:hypothetical protein